MNAKMSLLDEINERTQLPKPRTSAQFEAIESSSNNDEDEDDAPVILNRKIFKVKNPKLYNPDSNGFIANQKEQNQINAFEITATILEMNGGDCHSNQAIEKRWKAKMNEIKSEEKSDEQEVSNTITSVSEQKFCNSKYRYRKNALMRSLLEQKMAKSETCSLASSSIDDGKSTKDDDDLINGVMLTAHPDDPDFFCLRDTTKMSDEDDGYRFKHRGIKNTVTPRQFLIHEVNDDDFIFRKKSLF